MASSHHNPERRAWRGRSYRRHGESVRQLKESDMEKFDLSDVEIVPMPHPFASPRDREFRPGPGRVFVFGSNLRGMHGAGAAKTAYQEYGALWGVGEGLMPSGSDGVMSYALPTKDYNLGIRSPAEIELSVRRLMTFAVAHRELQFFVTRVGCGFAGYDDRDIAPMFQGAPVNMTLPIGWEDPDSL